MTRVHAEAGKNINNAVAENKMKEVIMWLN